MLMTLVQCGAAPIAGSIGLTLFLRASASPFLAAAAFISGFLGTFSLNQSIIRNLPAFQAGDSLQHATAVEAWLSGFVEAALPEECAKYVWALVLLLGWRQISRGHGALVGGLIGLGFAFRENLGYAQSAAEWRLMAVVSHLSWGVLLGSLLDRALESPSRRRSLFLLAFLAPVTLHGLLDTSIYLVEAHETQTGLTPANADPSALFHPRLLSAMALTISLEIISLVTAIRIIRRVRRHRVRPLDCPAV